MRRTAIVFVLLAAACGQGVRATPATPPVAGQGAGERATAPRASVPESEDGCPAVDRTLPALPVAADQGGEPSRDNLKAWIDYLANPDLRGRKSGSVHARHVAAVLSQQLGTWGYEPTLPGGGRCQRFPVADTFDYNVVASLPAPHPSARLVLLIAHYDHVGVDAAGRVHRGADDNASGVSAVLEAARVLSRSRSDLSRQVVVVFTGAEELGTVGSTWFVRHPPFDLSKVDVVLNLDQVGRQLLEGHPLRRVFSSFRDALGFVASQRNRDELLRGVDRATAETGISLIGIPEEVLVLSGYSSDSVPFSPFAPTLFLSTSVHEDYHRPTDTPDRIDLEQVWRASRIAIWWVRAPAGEASPSR